MDEMKRPFLWSSGDKKCFILSKFTLRSDAEKGNGEKERCRELRRWEDIIGLQYMARSPPHNSAWLIFSIFWGNLLCLSHGASLWSITALLAGSSGRIRMSVPPRNVNSCSGRHRSRVWAQPPPACWWGAASFLSRGGGSSGPQITDYGLRSLAEPTGVQNFCWFLAKNKYIYICKKKQSCFDCTFSHV